MANWGGKRDGAGRKPKVPGEKRKALSVTVSERNIERARLIAEHTGQTLSEVVDAMLSKALEALPFRDLAQGAAAPTVLERVVPQQSAVEDTADTVNR